LSVAAFAPEHATMDFQYFRTPPDLKGVVVRIVVVEDEDDLREDVVFNLSDAGFAARGVGDGGAG